MTTDHADTKQADGTAGSASKRLAMCLKRLPRSDYHALLTAGWLWLSLFSILLGASVGAALFVGALSQYPLHIVLGRIEFGRWYFGI